MIINLSTSLLLWSYVGRVVLNLKLVYDISRMSQTQKQKKNLYGD